MATLRMKNLQKVYDEKPVIHNFNLRINDGEFIVIVGPSGCGKSSLLRMVAGLEEVTSGTIYINGNKVNKLQPKDRNIAMVFQNYALYPHMTVYQNMAYGLRLRGARKKEIAQRVANTAEILGLEELLDRTPQELSGGQRQRVAMGRAIVRKPDIFLFDEPLSNLDTQLRVQMRLEIKKLQRELKTTSVYVTHDQTEAMTLADRLILMNAGRVEQIGTPLQIYENPASVFAAGFLGSPAMNFVSGRLNEDASKVVISDDLMIPLLDRHITQYAGCEVTVGFRPENLVVSDSLPNGFSLSIELVEALGPDSLLYGRLPGIDQRITARIPGKLPSDSGEQLKLSIASKHIYLFEKESGQRL